MSSSIFPIPILPSKPHNHPTQHHPISHFTLDEPPPSRKTPTIRTRLSQLCQNGQPHIAHQLFDKLPSPSTVLWNTIIIGFICNNLPFDALWLYSRMRFTPNVKCDSYTFSSVLKACADTKLLRVGKAVHCHVIRSHVNPSRIVYNSLLNMYSSCLVDAGVSELGEVGMVQRVFDSMKKRNVVAWNTMTSWLVKTERFYQGVMSFRLMLRMGIKPTPVSFVNVFPAVSGIGDFELGNVLYGMLFKLGSLYVDDLFVVSSAIVMYSEMGCVDIARKVFDGCVDKNVEVWNSMIWGYVQNNCYVEALELFVEALSSEHMSPDDVSYISALTAVSQLQQVQIGQQLHAHVMKSFTSSSVTVLNAVIVMYSRCNCIQESFEVFDAMVEKDIVSWNTMITALVQNGMDEEGLMLVYEMQRHRFMIDAVTITALLSASSNLRNEKIGQQTHAYLIRHGIEFQGMDSYLIDMYSKSGLMKKAHILFTESNDLYRDQATWNTMISGNTQNGLVEEAFIVFRQMQDKNMFPNAVTIASILPACGQIGSIALGKQLHGFATRHYLNHNVFVATALVDMYSKLGSISYARDVFYGTPTKSPVTYTSMISGFGQHGMGTMALSLFNEMKKSDVKPDAVTLIAVLSACSYAGLVVEGLHIFESMEVEYGIQPSVEHYACVVDMLGRDGRLREAFEIAESRDTKEGITVQAWGSLLAACRTHRQYELAKIVADKLLEMGTRNNMSGYYVLLSNIYADEGNWKVVDKVRKEMRERGQRKEVGCSWIEICGRVNYFVCKDYMHEKREAIYEILETLVADMEDAGYIPLCYSSMDEKYDDE